MDLIYNPIGFVHNALEFRGLYIELHFVHLMIILITPQNYSQMPKLSKTFLIKKSRDSVYDLLQSTFVIKTSYSRSIDLRKVSFLVYKQIRTPENIKEIHLHNTKQTDQVSFKTIASDHHGSSTAPNHCWWNPLNFMSVHVFVLRSNAISMMFTMKINTAIVLIGYILLKCRRWLILWNVLPILIMQVWLYI